MIKLFRYSSQSRSTLGVFHVNNRFNCYTLEDTHREEKIAGETRIPAGKYKVKLREFGGHYEKYKKKFAGHKGMLWIQDVPNFEDVLIHYGNEPKDTAGCILCGSTANNNWKKSGYITSSVEAYLDFYFKVLPFFDNLEEIDLEIIDLDEPFKH